MTDDYYDDRGSRRDDRREPPRGRDDRRDDYERGRGPPPRDDYDRGRGPPPRDDYEQGRGPPPRDDYERGRGPPPRDDHRRPPPPHGAPKPWIKPMVMLIIAIVLLGIALGTAWWHAEIKTETESESGGSGTMVFSTDYKTGEIDTKVDFSGDAYDSDFYEDDEETVDWDEMTNLMGENVDNMEDTFSLTGTLTIVAMILAIVALVFVIICGLRFLPLKIATILCLVAFLVALIAPIYFAASIGEACKKDDFPSKDGKMDLGDKELGPIGFISSDKASQESFGTKTSVEMTTYPTIGWILALVAMIFCVIALVQVNRMKRVLGPPMYGASRGPPGYGAPPPPRGPPRDDYDRGPPRDDRDRDRDRRPPPRDDYDRDRRPPPRDDYDRDRRPPPRDDW